MFKVCKQPSIRIRSQADDKSAVARASNAAVQTEVRSSLEKETQSLTVKDESVQVNSERSLSVEKARFSESNSLPADDQSNRAPPLANDSVKSSAPKEAKLTIQHVVWSCNLNQLILGFGVRAHTYWCTHKSRVEYCNLYQTSDRKPNVLKTIFQIEIKTCITSMVSHPAQFTQIAVGTKAGAIQIIDRDLSKTSSSCVRHESSDLHKLEIVFLAFKSSSSSTSQSHHSANYDELLSCSLDGCIVLWKLKQLERQLQPIRVFALSKQLMRHVEQLGIKCACLSSEQDSLLIGCENYLFSTLLTKRTANEELEIDFDYEQAKGELESIEMCPLNARYFLTNSRDGQLRLYETNTRTPLLTVYSDRSTAIAYKWINHRPQDNQLTYTQSPVYLIVGVQDTNLLSIMNLYKKDTKHFTTKQTYTLDDKYAGLFISATNQLALVRLDEVFVYDLNVLLN